MQATFTIFQLQGAPNAFGYLVESDAGHRIRQDYAPGAPGFTTMTEAEATAAAEALVAELSAPAPEPTPEPAPE